MRSYDQSRFPPEHWTSYCMVHVQMLCYSLTYSTRRSETGHHCLCNIPRFQFKGYHSATKDTKIPEQLKIHSVAGACKLIDGCSLALCCSATILVVSAGICNRNKVNSIAWIYRRTQPEDRSYHLRLLLLLVPSWRRDYTYLGMVPGFDPFDIKTWHIIYFSRCQPIYASLIPSNFLRKGTDSKSSITITLACLQQGKC